MPSPSARQRTLAQLLSQYGQAINDETTLDKAYIAAEPQLQAMGAQPGDVLRMEPFFRPFALPSSGGVDLKMPNAAYNNPPQPSQKRGS